MVAQRFPSDYVANLKVVGALGAAYSFPLPTQVNLSSRTSISEGSRGAVLLDVCALLSLSTFHSQPALSFSYTICFFDISPSTRPSAYTIEECPDGLLVAFFNLTSCPLPSPTFLRPGRGYLIMLFLPSFNPADQAINCTLKPFTLCRLFPEFLLPARELEWSIRGVRQNFRVRYCSQFTHVVFQYRYRPCHSSNFPATKIINLQRLFSAFIELVTEFNDFTEDARQLLDRCHFGAGNANIGIIMANAWNIGSNDFRVFRVDTFGTAFGNFLSQPWAGIENGFNAVEAAAQSNILLF